MPVYICPKSGCDSTDADWCSECGANMRPDTAPKVSAYAPPMAAPMLCPTCGTPRGEGGGRFCGVCRYDFETGQPFAPVPAGPTAAPMPVASPATTQPTRSLQSWVVHIDFDPTIDPTATPDISRPRPRLTFPLDLPDLLIGRAGTPIHPEIPIEDEGVSKRHARIQFNDLGQPTLLELGSTNGALVNGAPATPGLALPLKSGDEIVIGRWSRLTLKAT